MVSYHAKDASSALLPITLIYWFIGLGIIEYPLGHPRTILGLLYSFMVFTVYAICAFFLYLMDVELSLKLDSHSFGVSPEIIYVSNVIIVGFIIVVSIVSSKTRNLCIIELQYINGIMKRMGAVRLYKPFWTSQIRQFGCMIVMLVLVSIVTYFSVKRSVEFVGTSWFFSKWLVVHFPHFATTVNEIMLCNFNQIMTGSFEDLNSLLKSIREEDPCNAHDQEDNLEHVDIVSKDKQKMEMLYSMRKLYTRLVRVAKRWNQIHAVFILVLIVFSTRMFTIQIFFIYIEVSTHGILAFSENTVIKALLEMIFVAGILLMTVHSAVSLTTEARRTCGIILEHLHPIVYLRPEVRTFSMRLILSPLHLSVLGLYSLDYSMLQQITASVATYSVMLIQTMASPSTNGTES